MNYIEVMKQALEALERDSEAIVLLRQIRCSAERHAMPRQWLTDSDLVIGYWDKPDAVTARTQASTNLRLAIEQAKWHHPECEGECIACLIEREVKQAYGIQGLDYLRRHIAAPPQQECQGLTPGETK